MDDDGDRWRDFPSVAPAGEPYPGGISAGRQSGLSLYRGAGSARRDAWRHGAGSERRHPHAFGRARSGTGLCPGGIDVRRLQRGRRHAHGHADRGIETWSRRHDGWVPPDHKAEIAGYSRRAPVQSGHVRFGWRQHRAGRGGRAGAGTDANRTVAADAQRAVDFRPPPGAAARRPGVDRDAPAGGGVAP